VTVLERIVERRGRASELIRCANGPETVSHALRDWCHFNSVTTGYIEPGAPWQNPYGNRSTATYAASCSRWNPSTPSTKHNCCSTTWRLEYNHCRPHQSLNYETPAAFARRWRTEKQPRLS
jgi:transposase InsO family protein